ncbi:MAG TPA: phosphoribosylformylglycinamidine synthase subunit PurS [Leptospiraceae bacterium]|nr:phosphoribosylformylglycinamidine synthase subunit PurS [Leptospiraceae bacterium]
MKTAVIRFPGSNCDRDMGEEMVSDLRIGKYIEIKLNSKNIETAREDADRLCKKLLVNSVIETYKLEVIPE